MSYQEPLTWPPLRGWPLHSPCGSPSSAAAHRAPRRGCTFALRHDAQVLVNLLVPSTLRSPRPGRWPREQFRPAQQDTTGFAATWALRLQTPAQYRQRLDNSIRRPRLPLLYVPLRSYLKILLVEETPMIHRVVLQSSSLRPPRNSRTHLRLSTAPLWARRSNCVFTSNEGPVGRPGAETGQTKDLEIRFTRKPCITFKTPNKCASSRELR